MAFLGILLGLVYVVCWFFLGLATFRKGHYWLFWIGFLIPLLWIIGAFIAPIGRAAARGVTRSRPGESGMPIAKAVRNRPRVMVISGRTGLSEDGVS